MARVEANFVSINQSPNKVEIITASFIVKQIQFFSIYFSVILMKLCEATVLSISLSLFFIFPSGKSGGAEASQVGKKYQKWNSFKGLETKCKNQGPVECMKKICLL